MRVRIGGKDAFIQLVSPGQINAVLPADLPLGNITIEVLVTRGPGNTVTSEPVTMTLAAKAPYLLAPPAFSRGGKQHVVGVLPDGTFVGPPGLVSGANFRPARPGNRVVIYGIGFGPVTPEIPAGTVTISANALPPTRVRIGGQEAIVEFAGLANGYVGLYQFNVVVPSAPGGEVKFEIIVDGQPTSQALYFTIE